MKSERDVQNTFARRSLFLAVLFVTCFSIIAGRLYYLQIIEAKKYKVLAEDNRISLRLILPPRGEIRDRNGRVLATNVPSYDAVITYEETRDLNAVLENVSRLLELDEGDIERIRKDIRQKPRFIPVHLKKDLSWDEVSSLEVSAHSLPGVSVATNSRRIYRLNEAGAHVLGYVSSPNDQDILYDKSLILPGAKVGKSGIEKEYDEYLRGETGKREVEVNASGKIIRELSRDPPIPGENLYLSIDRDLQAFVTNLLSQYRSAAAVVLDIHTGEVLAMVSVPGYNPNLFFDGIDHKNWNELMDSPYKPMINKVIMGQYTPGSIFKIVVGLALLAEGTSAKKSEYCGGHIMLGSHKFHCWKKAGHGSVDFIKAMQQSCDVYYYKSARDIGHQPIIKMARLLGLDEKTGIDLPGEKKGFIGDETWKARTMKEPWYPGNTINLSIGQGFLMSTPLQLARLMALVSNGGKAITPHLLKGNALTEPASLKIQKDHLALILKGLNAAVNKKGGTSYRTQIKEKHFDIGGKTSTSQVRRISMAERLAGFDETLLPWHLRNNAMFVGYGPIDNPRFSVAVVAEHEGWGGQVGAPLGAAILEKVIDIARGENGKTLPNAH